MGELVSGEREREDTTDLRALRSGQRRLIRILGGIGATCIIVFLVLAAWSAAAHRERVSVVEELVEVIENFQVKQGRLPTREELAKRTSQGTGCGDDIERNGDCFVYLPGRDGYRVGWSTGIDTGEVYDSSSRQWREDLLTPEYPRAKPAHPKP